MSGTTNLEPSSLLDIANMNGPYIFKGKVTNTPPRDLLKRLQSNKHFTKSLAKQIVSIINCDDRGNAWIYYLCSALTRIFSYVQILDISEEVWDNPRSQRYYGRYTSLIKAMIGSLREALRGLELDVELQNYFIQFEERLSADTFNQFPDLLETVLNTNNNLLSDLQARSSEKAFLNHPVPLLLSRAIGDKFDNDFIRIPQPDPRTGCQRAWIAQTRAVDHLYEHIVAMKRRFAPKCQSLQSLVEDIDAQPNEFPEKFEKYLGKEGHRDNDKERVAYDMAARGFPIYIDRWDRGDVIGAEDFTTMELQEWLYRGAPPLARQFRDDRKENLEPLPNGVED